MTPSDSSSQPSGGGRKPPPFRPRFSIGILYLVAFFFLFSFLQVLPDLVALLEMPPGPNQELAAREAAQAATNPLASLLLAVLATALGSYYSVLPGMKVD